MIDSLFNLNNFSEKIFIYCKNDIIFDVNDKFLYLIGYNYSEIVGKSLKELNELLKCTYQHSNVEIKNTYNIYIFNNENIPKHINITAKNLNGKNERLYFIEEIPNQLLPGLLSTCINVDNNDKESIAIYSYPECVTLKINENYIKDSYFLRGKTYELIGNVCNFSRYVLDVIEEKSSNYENEVEVLDKDGKPTYWDISLMLISEDGKGKYIRASYYNQTEKVIKRKYLENQTKEKKIILDNILDSIAKTEKDRNDIYLRYASLSPDDFKIKYINELGIGRMNTSIKTNKINPKKFSVLELIGQDFFDFYGNEDENLVRSVKDAINQGRTYSHTDKFIFDDEIKYIKTIFEPKFHENNEIKEVNVIGFDITDEEITNQKILKTLKAQDEIFINTSHELKTPLNLIFSASQLLNIYSTSENIEGKKDQIIHNNKIITQNCYRIIKLINNILDISKIEEGFCELDIDNNDIVKYIDGIVKSVSEYTEDLELKIIFESEIKEKYIGFDMYKIERIMLNLISNAIKYSNSNGVISVKLTEKDDFIEISVIDNGIGINKDDFDVIFEKFRQVNKSLNRKVEGTGVGLSLVKSLVELHKGRISVDSTLGQGSTFKVFIPSTTMYKSKKSEYDYCHDNRVEMIKFELSDIYS